MRVLKERSRHLEDQMERKQNYSRFINLIILLISLVGISGIIWSFSMISSGRGIPSGYDLIIIVSSVGLFQIACRFHKSYRRGIVAIKKGIEGEQTVTDELKHLNDKFYLVNDIVLREGGGNLDHVVIGPTGIFAIETKNYKGNIICNGDDWSRRYRNKYGIKDYVVDSPSKQAKGNAIGLRNILINNLDFLKYDQSIFVSPIVVFTNPEIQLELNNPAVPVLQIHELNNYITDFKSDFQLTNKELEAIARSIV